MIMKGKFITFEGPEGCGKSTQSRLLSEYLKRKGFGVVYLREPGGVKISEKIRKILLDPRSQISPIAETLLYMAARAEVVDTIIKPALSHGKIVICDRFLDSTVVYQGYGLGISIDLIRRLGDFVTDGIKPNLTILLDLPLKKGLKHRQLKKDRIEGRPFSYHLRVKKGYLHLAALEPKRIKIVRVENTKGRTQGKIRELTDRFLKGS